MMDPRTVMSTSGDVKDVASFFRVSVRTVHNWKSERPPLIDFFQEGENVCFGEEAIVRFRVRRSRLAVSMSLSEQESIARREWRDHLKLRREDALVRAVEELRGRLEIIERKAA